jgi:hypothetical protein
VNNADGRRSSALWRKAGQEEKGNTYIIVIILINDVRKVTDSGLSDTTVK